MNYKQTIEYIHNTPKFSRVLGNDLLKKLLVNMKNPQKDLKFIHIAGTNGKGSCAVMLSEILINSGLTVGLFTSPYIEKFNERIKVNGIEIPDRELSKITTKIRKIIEKYDTPVSEFALDTAIAFEYFKNQNCDIVILEVGLGGRLDATNVIDESLLSIIMSIGLDHTEYLGETIEEITAEKCGIIKKNGTVILYPSQTNAEKVVKSHCKRQNATLIKADEPIILDGNNFEYNGKIYELSMGGDFQKYNAATVLCAISVLKKHFDVSEDAVISGLKSAFNPARLEKLKCGLVIDGAHNLPAIKELCKALSAENKPIVLCYAQMQDKNVAECIKELSSLNPSVIATEINMPRCEKAEKIADEFKKYNIDVIIEKNPIIAAKMAVKYAGKDKIPCVCGSLYLAGEVRKELKKSASLYYVYILRCSDNSLYTGITTDVERRFKEHSDKNKKGAKYTHSHNVKSVEAVWTMPDRSSASKLEYYIKSLSKTEKEGLIKSPDKLIFDL